MDMETFPDVVELNVGGKLMTTLLSTLTKDPQSMLAAMFSGRHVISKDKEGRYFIDCNGHLFEYVLNYLRFGSLPPKEVILDVHDLAVYFNIQSLVESLEKFHTLQHRKRIAELKTQIDIKQFEKLKQQAIEKIYSCSASPNDSKTLHIIPNSNICMHGRDMLNCTGRYGVPVRNKINIYLTNAGFITKELKTCLAHDLSELGFGIYNYIIDTAYPLRHICCSTECHHIALLPHNLVTVFDVNNSVA
ncbi:BTB/POZ domain-containing protein KCTD7-like [Mercenaria mercenaria]|uniref:BTB/POZ domain-containing protein KCTD7-like n=1 Tax=Mercenaria mercenaria TaxID=6596 RepID=UPI00234F8DBE|nr:BTB/POZ domain-containing protein KCTD7-like [Mercenaria mercenaria]